MLQACQMAPLPGRFKQAERCAELIWNFLSRSHLYRRPGGLGKPVFRMILGSAWGISFLNYYWFYKMCRGAFKVLRRKKTPASSRKPIARVDEQPQNGGSVASASSATVPAASKQQSSGVQKATAPPAEPTTNGSS